MAKEYIERGALLEELQEEIVFESAMYTEEQNKWLCTGLRIATRDVRKQPTADVVPRDEVAKIFEEIESVLFTVASPSLSTDGTIEVKHSKDFYLRREDYYTIKEKYTKGGAKDE